MKNQIYYLQLKNMKSIDMALMCINDLYEGELSTFGFEKKEIEIYKYVHNHATMYKNSRFKIGS